MPVFTMSLYRNKEDLYKDKSKYYEQALMKIKERFDGKLELHKEDCFAYQVAVDALNHNDL